MRMASEGVLVPLIDLAKFEAEKEKLKAAVIECGFFRLINHGIPEKLMADMKTSVRSLFELPIEVKRRNTDIIPKSGHVELGPQTPFYEGLGIYDASSPTDIHNFCSLLDVSSHDREIMCTYASKLHDLIMDLASKVAKSLGIMSYSFDGWHCHLRMNQYNFTKEIINSSSTGLVHTDNSFITILLEDELVDGLQIMDSTKKFVPIDPVPGTFLVNMGDIAKVWSNGKVHNVKHTVVCNKTEPRITVALFMLAPKDYKVEPQVELIDSEHPQLYRGFDYIEYRTIKMSSPSITGEVLLHWAANEATTMA